MAQLAGSGTGLPGPGQQLSGSPGPVGGRCPHRKLRKGAQGGGRLDHTAQGACGPPGAQHGQRRRCSRHQPTPTRSSSCRFRVGSAWGPAQVQVPVPVGAGPDAPMPGGKDQPGIGLTRRWYVEGDVEPSPCVIASIECSLFLVDFLSRYPRFQRSTLPAFKGCKARPSVDSG